MAATIARIRPQQAHQHLEAGADTMLVCAYDNEDKFQQNYLEGAISLEAFKSQVEALPRDREIIFYCKAAESQRSRTLRPRLEEADRVGTSICPYCAVGCAGRRHTR